MSRDIVIHFPPGQEFSCTGCGKCCRQEWRIRVHPDESRGMERLEAYQNIVRAGYQPLVVVDDIPQLGKRPDQACFFLESDELCSLHREAGPRVKPASCRLYPYQLVETPNGYYVSLAFTCPAVLCGTGQLTEKEAQGLEQTVRDAEHFFPADSQPSTLITVAQDITIPWQEYLEWESSLHEQILKSVNLTETLTRILSVLCEAVVKGEAPSWESPPSECSNTVYQRLHEMLPTFRTLSLATIEQSSDLEERQSLLAQLHTQASFHSQVLGEEIPCEEKPGTRDQLTGEILRRYLHNQLWGKRLITGPSLLVRLLYLTISLELFWLYLSGAKQSSGELHFAPKQVERCFEFLEAQAVYHQDILNAIFLEWECDLLGAAYQNP